MKLYLTPGVCSLSPHIVLEELGIAHETESVNLKTKVTASGGNYLSVNPKGYVPALQLSSGEVLTEGPAIIQYLADLHPEKKLAPPNGSLARYQLQSWLNFIATELHKNFSPFFNPAAPDEMKAIARANIERRLGYVNEQLEGRQHLLGEDFTVADAYLFTVLGWARIIQLDLSPWTHLTAYQARVGARPGVQRALKAEGLI
jgi:glutathione S-transferase